MRASSAFAIRSTAFAFALSFTSAIRHAKRLRWRRAQGFMNAAEIVVSDVQRDCRDVALPALA